MHKAKYGETLMRRKLDNNIIVAVKDLIATIHCIVL